MQKFALTGDAEILHFSAMESSPLARAIAAAGGSVAFIKAIGISPRTLASWKKEGVPDTRWRSVSVASNGAVSTDQLALERAAKSQAEAA